MVWGAHVVDTFREVAVVKANADITLLLHALELLTDGEFHFVSVSFPVVLIALNDALQRAWWVEDAFASELEMDVSIPSR